MASIAPALKRLAGRSYFLSSAQRYLKSMTRPAYRLDPIIVYQMGKVGSEALEASLQHAQLQRPLFRVHAMVRKNIVEGLKAANTNPRAYFRRSKVDFYGYHLGREIRRDLHRHRWQVITMVRDPLAQHVSSFFQIIDLLIPDFAQRLEREEIGVDELVALFLEHYPPDNIFLRWFEEEFEQIFGVNVYDRPFPTARGYVRLEWSHLDLLIIRLEDFDDVAVPAIEDFLGIRGFRLQRKNEASVKPYAELYRRFLAEAALPRDYVQQIYASRLARHFYSEQERCKSLGRLLPAS